MARVNPFLILGFFFIVFIGILSLILLNSNSFPYINSYDWAPKYGIFQIDTYHTGQTNSDGTYTYFYAESRIESVQEKLFLLKPYTVLSLRARVGSGFSSQIATIPLPGDLISTGIIQITPNQLSNYLGKLI